MGKGEVKSLSGRAPRVLLPIIVKLKMDIIVEEGHGRDEVAFLGTVERTGRDFLVTDLFIPKQEVHAATCEITPEGLLELANNLTADQFNKLRIWGHSHVDMGTSPSGQDQDQMKALAQNCNDFFIRVIANKKHEVTFDIFIYDQDILVSDAQWELVHGIDDCAMRASIKADLADKVKPFTYATTYVGGSQYSGHMSNWQRKYQNKDYVWDATIRDYKWIGKGPEPKDDTDTQIIDRAIASDRLLDKQAELDAFNAKYGNRRMRSSKKKDDAEVGAAVAQFEQYGGSFQD